MSEVGPATTVEEGLMSYDQYCELKSFALGLVTHAGAAIADSDYEVDFTLGLLENAMFGDCLQLIHTVRVALADKPKHNHESILLEIEATAVTLDGLKKLFRRNVSVTVNNSQVAYARVKSVLPTEWGVPKAQPDTKLTGPVRQDFEDWEWELRETQTISPDSVAAIMKELQELTM